MTSFIANALLVSDPLLWAVVAEAGFDRIIFFATFWWFSTLSADHENLTFWAHIIDLSSPPP